MNIPTDLLYTKNHEWVRLDGEIVTIGITDYAQRELGDVVFVELPQIGDSLTKGDVFGTIEAVKAVSDLYVPLSGEITAVNNALEETPEKINTSPYEDGWMIKIKVSDSSENIELLSAEQYQATVGEE